MKIASVRPIPLKIPVSKSYVWSHGIVDFFTNVLIEVKSDEGLIGYGESDIIFGVSQESPETIVQVVHKYITPAILGKDPFNIEEILESMDDKIDGHYSAKSGVEFALWDLKGKYLRQPAYNLLGGKVREKIEVDFTIGIDTPEAMAQTAKKMLDFGYRTFVVKVGRDNELDLERVRKVREAVGPSVKIRVDVNEGYTVEKAIKMIRLFEKYDIQLVEQPVARWDTKGMSKVARAVDTPISADESNSSPQAAYQLIENDAVDILNIKLPYHGGIWNSIKVASVAESAGIPVIVGGMNHYEVGRQANRHFAITTPTAYSGYAHEGPGPASQSLTDNITKDVITYEDVKSDGGFVKPGDGYGLSFVLDESKVRQYAYEV
ncbi:MAG: mandelate racemase/muconate lactonizing enzyme family protein [Nitrososphaerota archaeon]|nr:mandelate racemase/muconate lactonizing enzyme family protein [Nitrososphaerota archaeon]